MKSITLPIPSNVVSAYRAWLDSTTNHPRRTISEACSHSVRILTPTGPEDSRWKRSLDSSWCGSPTDRSMLTAISQWRRIFPCIDIVITMDADVHLRVTRVCRYHGITVEDFLFKSIGYHASLSGQLKTETAFHRFERALAIQWRDDRAGALAGSGFHVIRRSEDPLDAEQAA